MKLTMRTIAAVVLMGGLAGEAAEFEWDGTKVRTRGTISFGSAWRADARDPELFNGQNSNVIGIPSTAFGPNGRNNDDANLNYSRGDRISTVAKGFAEIDVSQRGFGILGRAIAWYDHALKHDGVLWGHVPNGYSRGSPLSDNGLSKYAKFSGVQLADLYAYGTFGAPGTPVTVKAGNQTIAWGIPATIPGGLNSINPINQPAIRRPGVFPEEVLIPFPALFAKATVAPGWTAEAFYQFSFNPSEPVPCGTFYSPSDIIAPGCDKLPLGTTSDPASLAAGAFLKRDATQAPSPGGGAGVAIRHALPQVGAEVALYFMQLTSRAFAPDFVKSQRTGPAPFIPGDAGGLNPRYFTLYPEDVRTFGLTAAWRDAKSSVQGELTYRPNQPVTLNIPDMLNAFVSLAQPSPLRQEINALAPGAIFQGYDRRRLTSLQLLARTDTGPTLGAAGLTLGAEAGLRYINDLPDVAVRRYGRSDAYGLGPVGITCLPGAPAKQCSSDGYVTKASWGYRLRAALRYPAVAQGLELSPALVFTHDVKGWSNDFVFIQDRQILAATLRANYRSYIAELGYAQTWGGAYNFFKDRDVFYLTVGWRF